MSIVLLAGLQLAIMSELASVANERKPSEMNVCERKSLADSHRIRRQ